MKQAFVKNSRIERALQKERRAIITGTSISWSRFGLQETRADESSARAPSKESCWN